MFVSDMVGSKNVKVELRGLIKNNRLAWLEVQ